MSKDLTKKAVDMLLKGATLLGEPCPYCKGVRVMKDGHALCVNCGKEPKIELESKISELEKNIKKHDESPNSILAVLEKKLAKLSKELENEKDHAKQQDILKLINSIIEIIEKLQK